MTKAELTNKSTAAFAAAALASIAFVPAFLFGVITAWMPVVALLLAWNIKLQLQGTIAACAAITDPAAQLRTALTSLVRSILLSAMPIPIAAATTAWLSDAGVVHWAGLAPQSIDKLSGLYPVGVIPLVPAEREVTDLPSMIVIAVGQLSLCLMLALLLVARRQLWDILHRVLAAYAVTSELVDKIAAAERCSWAAVSSVNAGYIAPALWYALNAMCLWRNDPPAMSPMLVGATTFLEMTAALSTLFAWAATMGIHARAHDRRSNYPSQ